MKQLARLLAGTLLAGFLGACTVLVPDPPEPVPSTVHVPDRLAELPPDCPRTGSLVESEGLDARSEAQSAADLLTAVDEWSNAGSTMVANEPDWADPDVPEHCLVDLAEIIGGIHGSALLAAGGDQTVAVFRKELTGENLDNLKAARTQGHATNIRRELVVVQRASTSQDGMFLNLVVRRLGSGAGESSGMEEWFVIVAPQGQEDLVFHLETKDAEHGSFTW